MSRPAVLHEALGVLVRGFNRNPWTYHRLELRPREAGEPDPVVHDEDGLRTRHARPFVDDARFQRAYARGVQAAGWDYGIRWRVHTALWAAATAEPAGGAFVECGTARGVVAAAICTDLGWTTRPFYLYDTYASGTLDADGGQTGPPHPCYATDVESVRRTFAEWPGARLVVGRIPDSLAESPEQVAFLHVDLNAATAEEAAVRHFWPRLSRGAVMLFDDYGFAGHEAQRIAADRLGDELGYRILSLPTGQGLVVKTAA
jgi:hypothetical protein